MIKKIKYAISLTLGGKVKKYKEYEVKKEDAVDTLDDNCLKDALIDVPIRDESKPLDKKK